MTTTRAFVPVVFALVALTAPAFSASIFGNKPVTAEGSSDCGDWLNARSHGHGTSVALEHFVLGALDGLSLGADIEFWRADGHEISWEAAYFWIDNYCHSHPTDMLMSAILRLFTARTKTE